MEIEENTVHDSEPADLPTAEVAVAATALRFPTVDAIRRTIDLLQGQLEAIGADGGETPFGCPPYVFAINYGLAPADFSAWVKGVKGQE